VAQHRGLERVACAELSDGVRRALPLFDAVNDGVGRRAGVEIAIQDGRHWIAADSDTWDAITLEPPPPLNAGVGDLYSLEFYRICRERLAPGGVLCQWFPLHSQSVEEFRMGLATFVEVFPDASLWLPVGRNAVGIGVKEGGAPWTYERVVARWVAPEVAGALAAIGYPSPEALLATMVLDADGIRRVTSGAKLVTDDRPRLEFHDLRDATGRFPAGELLVRLMRERVDARAWLAARGGAGGADQDAWSRSVAALEHFYRGAFFFEAHRTAEAVAEWQTAREIEPENAYWRAILRPASTGTR
jgi:hypothetical protein